MRSILRSYLVVTALAVTGAAHPTERYSYPYGHDSIALELDSTRVAVELDEGNVSLGAVDHNGVRASFSQYGPGIDVVGPGVSVLTTDRSGSAGYTSTNYVTTNGKSLSTPSAAGVAALVLSVNPALTADEVDAIV